jgi:hypothetical protein
LQWTFLSIWSGVLIHNIRLVKVLRSGRFLTGSGSDFYKRPDPNPDPGLNKFRPSFFWKYFWLKYSKVQAWPKKLCSRFLKYLWLFTHTKKLRPGSGSGSDQKDPDQTGSGSATLGTTQQDVVIGFTIILHQRYSISICYKQR